MQRGHGVLREDALDEAPDGGHVADDLTGQVEQLTGGGRSVCKKSIVRTTPLPQARAALLSRTLLSPLPPPLSLTMARLIWMSSFVALMCGRKTKIISSVKLLARAGKG